MKGGNIKGCEQENNGYEQESSESKQGGKFRGCEQENDAGQSEPSPTIYAIPQPGVQAPSNIAGFKIENTNFNPYFFSEI